jgi:hypothetical protein
LSSKYAPLQLDMFDREAELEKIENLEDCVHGLRARFGHHTVRLGASVLNPKLVGINPRDDHTSPAVAYHFG